MIYVVNFANEKYRKAQYLNTWSAYKFGKVDKVLEYSPSDIDYTFYTDHKRILSFDRGCGLWLWKPYFILKALKQIDEGDYLFYCDSASIFIRDIRNILTVMKGDIWVSEIPLLEKQFTKESTFVAMQCENDIYRNSYQIQATFFCVRKSRRSMEFVSKWLEYACDFELISPRNCNETKNCREFISHREDQSILSLLSKKEGILPHLDPSQFGRVPELYFSDKSFIKPMGFKNVTEYKVCFILHRQYVFRIKSILLYTIQTFFSRSFIIALFRMFRKIV